MKIQHLSYGGGQKKLTKLVVIVGPNNSGKSSFLADLYDQFRNTAGSGPGKWPSLLDGNSAKISIPDYKEWAKDISEVDDRPFGADEKALGYSYSFYGRQETALRANEKRQLDEVLYDKKRALKDKLDILNPILARQIKGSLSALVSTADRLQFAASFNGSFVSPRTLNQQLTSFLFNNPPILESMNDFLARFYDRKLYILGHNHPNYEALIADNNLPLPPIPRMDSRGINSAGKIFEEWRNKYGLKPPTAEGDGIKALLPITFALGNPYLKTLFIDEPEAHLYPQAKRTLGKLIAERSKEKQTFVVTHDGDIFESLLLNANEFNIIRITHSHSLKFAKFDKKNMRKIGSERKQPAAAQPVFHDSAIFVEGPSDSYFYRKVYEEVRRSDFSTFFVDCSGSDRIKNHLGIAISLEVPFATILDFDTLKNKDGMASSSHAFSVLKRMAKAKAIPRKRLEVLEASVNNLQREIIQFNANYVNKKPKTAKRNQPKDIKNLITALSEYGIFIVPTGKLESWYALPNEPVEYQVRHFDNNKTSTDYRELRGFLRRVEANLGKFLR